MDEEYTIFANKKRGNIPKRGENQTIISKRCENKHDKLLYVVQLLIAFVLL